MKLAYAGMMLVALLLLASLLLLEVGGISVWAPAPGFPYARSSPNQLGPRPEEARTAPQDAAPTHREAVRGSVRILGRLTGAAGPRHVRLVADAETPAARVLAEGDSGVSGEFDFLCTGPIARLRVDVSDSYGMTHKQFLSRSDLRAMEAWDLGVLHFGIAINVTLQLDYSRDVVQALGASRQKELNVEIRTGHAGGPVLGEARLDLSSLTEAPFGLWSYEACITDSAPDSDLFVQWVCSTEYRQGPIVKRNPTMRHVELLPGVHGRARRSTLRLHAEGLLQGVVVSKDEGLWPGIPVVYRSDDPGQLARVVVHTGMDGRFALYIGAGQTGAVSLGGRLQLESGIGENGGVRGCAGTSVRLELPVRRVRFRMVDDAGRPVETYRVESRLMEHFSEDLRDRDRHLNGIAWITDMELRSNPWLRFDVSGQKGMFLAPSSWAECGDCVHDVRVSSLHALGDISITRRDSPNRWPPETAITLRGLGPLRDYSYGWLTAPRSSSWRIRDLPSGDYSFTLRSAGREIAGQATIVAGREGVLIIDLP